jgi:hypothetical protein
MTRLGIFLIWLLHFLPLPLLARIGQGFGMLLYAFARERRRVARTNLRLCFPEMPEKEREALVRRHFRAFGRGMLEFGILWWSSKERIQRLVKNRGHRTLACVGDKPVIWLVCHFVGWTWAVCGCPPNTRSRCTASSATVFRSTVAARPHRFGTTTLFRARTVYVRWSRRCVAACRSIT